MARPSIAKTPFAQRLTAVRLAVGDKDRKAFAEQLGMNAETLGGYERGDSLPDHWFLEDYKRRFSVNLDWLLTGDGEMFHPPTGRPNSAPALGAENHRDPDKIVYLPFYPDVHAAAGLGAVPSSEMQDGIVAFDQQLLRALDVSENACSVIRSSGDSMLPTIPDKSLLVVDHSQNIPRDGCIMVIGLGDDILVKRIRRWTDGRIDLISDNTLFSVETLGPDALAQLRIVGRVIYICRTP